MFQRRRGFRSLLLCTACLLGAGAAPTSGQVSNDDRQCIDCHNDVNPGLVGQWRESKHATSGAGCLACHAAQAGDADGWTHEGQLISSVVTPRDCAECHPREAVEFQASHHSSAAMFIGSLDNFLGEVIAGKPAAVMGCQQCHGSAIKISKQFDDGSSFEIDMAEISAKAIEQLRASGTDPFRNKEILSDNMTEMINAAYAPHKSKTAIKLSIDKDSWPNSGVGRINPDGSMGSCNACHSRHTFSRALARQPDNCGKCHMGPDHPQIEVYNESKHGIAFRNRLADMNLDSPDWIVGQDYSAAPTCATCHMSATREQPITHDLGLRIAWTLRPIISKMTTSHTATLNDDDEIEHADWGPERKRAAMKDVCSACHGPTHVDNFFAQFDSLVELYNGKFAAPAKELMDYVWSKGYVDKSIPFNHELEWVFFELWHHEGRRMRHGAAMMGPDYTHWHGSYEVAKHFYMKFIPMIEEIAEEKNDATLTAMLAELMAKEEHSWRGGLSKENRAAMMEFYKSRYGE